MAHSTRFGRDLFDIRLDVAAAVAGLVLAIAMLPLRLLASQVLIETIPIVLGLACGLYLLAVYRQEYPLPLPVVSSAIVFWLPTVTLTGMAGLVFLATYQGTRSLGFFTLAAIIASLILLQILFTREPDFNAGNLLLQVVAYAFVIRLTALLVTPGFIGVDIWSHVPVMAGAILEEGSLDAISNNKHYSSPFYHVLVVAAALLYDASLRTGLILSLGLVMPLSILLVYATGALLVPQRWAVLAAALYAVGDYVIHWGMHLIPTSLGLVFFLGVLYMLVRIMRTDTTNRDFAILVLLSIAVILTHQITTFIMLVLLGAAFLAQLSFNLGVFEGARMYAGGLRNRNPVNMLGLLVFDFGLTIFMWSLTPFRGETFLLTVFSFFYETLVEDVGFLQLAGGDPGQTGDAAAAAAPTLIDQIARYVEPLGLLILLGLTFAGCLFFIRRERAEQTGLTLLLAAAVMIVFVLGLPILGIRNFVPSRWFAFLYAPMVLLGVVGFRYLAAHLGTTTVVALIVVVALVYPGAMLIAAPSNYDNPVLDQRYERLAYNHAELQAAETIREMTGGPMTELRPDQVLYTDHPYQSMLRRSQAYLTQPATVMPDQPVEHEMTVYRQAQSSETTHFRNEDERAHSLNIPEEQMCRPTQATVYSNGQVTFCTPSPASG